MYPSFSANPTVFHVPVALEKHKYSRTTASMCVLTSNLQDRENKCGLSTRKWVWQDSRRIGAKRKEWGEVTNTLFRG
jgi:hypothetical protein